MAFDLQPTLENDLVTLRPLVASDFPALYGVACDPLIWEQHPVPDRYQEVIFREFFRQALAAGGTLLISETATGRVLGSSRYHGYNEALGEVEIGWTFLDRSCWGGHYNREIKRLMLAHAFRFVERVIFIIGRKNRRSQRAMEKIGGALVGSRPDAGGHDSLLYRFTAAAFDQHFVKPTAW